MSISVNIGRPFLSDKTLDEQARSILRKYGTDAHVYLPGAGGVAVSGLLTNNYTESTFVTYSSVDGVVGGVRDATGSIDATQSTTANKPAERRGLYNELLNSATPATQSVTCIAAPYTLALYGTGSVTLSGTGSGTLNGTGASDLVVLNFTPTAGSVTFTKSGTVSSFGLFKGTLTAAQILAEGGIPLTTSAAASNSAAGRYWWQLDGTNDSLALGSVPFQSTDDHCVIVGTTVSSVAAGSKPLVSNYGTTTRRVAQVSVETATLTATWTDDAGTAGTSPSGSVVSAGVAFVATARKVGNAKELRKNGASINTSSTAMGTTTLTNSAIGYNGTNYYNGASGPTVLIKGTVSDADLLTLERWVASLTPNGPQF